MGVAHADIDVDAVFDGWMGLTGRKFAEHTRIKVFPDLHQVLAVLGGSGVGYIHLVNFRMLPEVGRGRVTDSVSGEGNNRIQRHS